MIIRPAKFAYALIYKPVVLSIQDLLHSLDSKLILLIYEHGLAHLLVRVNSEIKVTYLRYLLERQGIDSRFVTCIDEREIAEKLRQFRFRKVKKFDVSSLDLPHGHFIVVLKRGSARDYIKQRKTLRKYLKSSILSSIQVPVLRFEEEIAMHIPVKVGIYVEDEGGKVLRSINALEAYVVELADRVNEFLRRILARVMYIIPTTRDFVIDVGVRLLKPSTRAFMYLNTHHLVVGATQSGKTNLLTLLTLKLSSIPNVRVIVFDSLGNISLKLRRFSHVETWNSKYSLDTTRVKILRVPDEFSFDPFHVLVSQMDRHEAFAQAVTILNRAIEYTCPERDILTSIQQQVMRAAFFHLLKERSTVYLQELYDLLTPDFITKTFESPVYIDDLLKAAEAVKRRLELLLPYFKQKSNLLLGEGCYVLDLSKLSDFARAVFLMTYLTTLFRLPITHEFFNIPTFIIIDEAKYVAPELKGSESFLSQLIRIAANYNIKFILATQEYTKIDSSIRSNTASKVIFRIFSSEDLNTIIKDLFTEPENNMNWWRRIITSLKPGQCIYYNTSMYDLYYIDHIIETTTPKTETTPTTFAHINIDEIAKTYNLNERQRHLLKICLTMHRDNLIKFIIENRKLFFNLPNLTPKQLMKALIHIGKIDESTLQEIKAKLSSK